MADEITPVADTTAGDAKGKGKKSTGKGDKQARKPTEGRKPPKPRAARATKVAAADTTAGDAKGAEITTEGPTLNRWRVSLEHYPAEPQEFMAIDEADAIRQFKEWAGVNKTENRFQADNLDHVEPTEEEIDATTIDDGEEGTATE